MRQLYHWLSKLDWKDGFRRYGVDVFLVVACALQFVRAFFVLSDYGFDDSYITYTIAQNLGAGEGFVFNPGSRIQVSTSPLYTLYLAVFATLGADLPTVSKLSSALFCTGTSVVLLALGRRVDLVWPARIAVILFAIHPEILRTYGHETPLYVLLMLSAVCCFFRGRELWATVLCALLVLCRGDGILLSVVLFVGFIVRQRTFPFKQLLLFIAIVAPWFIFATAYFGEPLPNTLHAKILQHQIMRYPSFFDQLLKQATKGGAVAVVQIFVAGAGCLSVIKRTPELLVWCCVYVAGYCALRVSGVFFWWYVPLLPVVWICYGAGIESIAKRLGAGSDRRFVQVAVTAMVCALSVTHLYFIHAQHQRCFDYYIGPRIGERAKTSKVGIYEAVGRKWMRPCMRPGEDLAMTEIGALGYYGRRRILDLFGLASPEVLPLLRKSPLDKSAVIATLMPEYYGDFSWRNWIHDIRNDRAAKGTMQREHRRRIRLNYRLHRRFLVKSKHTTATFLIYRRNDLIVSPKCGK